MEEIRFKYKLLIFSTIIIMCSFLSVIYISYSFNVEVAYRRHAQQSIVDIKKSFLSDTVNNVIYNIEQKDKEVKKYYKNILNEYANNFKKYYSLAPESFLISIIEHFDNIKNKDMFTILIVDKKTNQIVYDDIPDVSKKYTDFIDQVNIKKSLSFYFVEENYEEYYIFMGIRDEYINKIVKEYISKEIHGFKFSNDVYVWVNEVLDYSGGDNYAIRRIHPNLTETEGQYLSTNTTDIKGNTPYLTELEGIKENGEIFFTYYFKRKNSHETSEKLTYAKLYEKYNWIIAMGIHLDDIQIYVDKTTTQSQQILEKTVRNITMLTFILVVISLIVLSILEKWYYKNSNRKLKEEINIDPLTKSFNRRAATKDISLAFQNYIHNNINSTIIIFDIDDFKKVNDNYGHDVGDYVLINLVNTVNNSIRSTDKLYRWGGEEFLLICQEMSQENIMHFSDKILRNASQISYGDKNNKITISIGFSCFHADDTTYENAIKRADIGLYNAKKNGKNKACM